MMPDKVQGVTLAQPDGLEEDACAMLPPPEDLRHATWKTMAGELGRLVRAAGVASDQVDDLLQDVFLAAWRQPHPFQSEVELRRWFYRVALNRALLEHRRRSRWQRALHRLTNWWPVRQAASADAGLRRREEQQLVQQALNELAPHLRAVLMLRYFSQLDSTEIARVLSIPDSTVRSRLRVARERLADSLRRRGYDDA